MIQIFDSFISEEAIINVEKVLRSGFLNEGQYVKDFEERLEHDWGLRNVSTTNSCTSALHLSLAALDIGPGDEVVVACKSFVATGLAVLMCGAKVAFCDVDYNGNMCPEDLKIKITNKTKAIICVHWGGIPCDLAGIRDTAKQFEIPVIEDAAHAFGAEYYGWQIGSISDFTCFSFQSIKTLTTGDGGAICTIHDKYVDRIKELKWFGMNKSKMVRNVDGSRDCDVSRMGYKYHMNDVAASIGLGNLLHMTKVIGRRRQIAGKYNYELQNCFDAFPTDYIYNNKLTSPSYWLYPVCTQYRDRLTKHMAEKGVVVSAVDKCIHKNSIFKYEGPKLVVGEYLDKHQTHLPIRHSMSENDVNQVINSVRSYYEV